MKNSESILLVISLILVLIAGVIYGPSVLTLALTVISSLLVYRLLGLLKLKKSGKPFSKLWILFLLPVMFVLMIELSVVTDMMRQKGPRSEIKGNEVIIVPGAGINGEEPSLYLKARLDGAANIMKQHPGTKAVVSGAKGRGEVVTESEVMKKYLIREGIDGNRIFEENKAASTFNNFKYSKEIMEKEGLGEDIIIVTNSFHNLRSMKTAEQYGLKPIAAPAPSPIFGLRIFYALKESASFLKMIIESVLLRLTFL
ncbi:MAG: YdcF family protein [Clostridiaceae bacterium]